ncbi:hypothetical protein P872_10885 [Rhodonellum psychrophilum GCM71 = DSM 17998]|uniref:HMA domain-containing protein n=2 Tax=Rhodonellum TaxID=336827 RepID=U5BWG5_9BACT|nr:MULTISPECIES: hypothetical protein [Rhodonellum]ERM80946.1 hypothetical protein P872_10885 [Rhodonellum psychrophilum GCM71 = DSM 17998]MDO9554755.1 heavy-metal-associated domain-containing protein [Rhodonellum sp.]SDY82673.1 hypothetical protein SAMN05444412_10352 [Rhodonellum ikkaensis]
MIKKILIGAVAIVLLLVATLAIHIYLVTQPKEGAMPTMTMSRIDFPSALDSLEGYAIRDFVKNTDGMKDTRVNLSMGHLVCLYDRNQKSPQEIVSDINDNFMTSAVLFQPSDDMLAQSCPAINKSSLTYKLGAFFQKTFEN